MWNKERTLLKWKYLYYNGKTEVSDSVYDLLENELRELGSVIPNIVDSPTLEILAKYDLIDELKIGERELRFHHTFPMLSLKKYQVTQPVDEELFPVDLKNFVNKVVNPRITCTPKFDGNSMEISYHNGQLYIALTRGNEEDGGGLDRTEKVKLLVPNMLPVEYQKFGKIVIRGEVIIPTTVWEEKYSDPNKVTNPRNWLAGVMNTPEGVPDEIINDMSFVAFRMDIFDGGTIVRPENQLQTLNEIGFDKVFSLEATSFDQFFDEVYPKFKEYRVNSEYALDGIVLNFSSEHWEELGETSHHPNWACAVKFVPNKVETVITDIVWTLGKDSELTPVALYRPTELDGTVVRRASLHNLGWIVENKVYPGCTVEIAKAGEIIPQVIKVVNQSPDNDAYETYIKEFVNEFEI